MSSFVTMRCHLLELKKNKRATLYTSKQSTPVHTIFTILALQDFKLAIFEGHRGHGGYCDLFMKLLKMVK